MYVRSSQTQNPSRSLGACPRPLHARLVAQANLSHTRPSRTQNPRTHARRASTLIARSSPSRTHTRGARSSLARRAPMLLSRKPRRASNPVAPTLRTQNPSRSRVARTPTARTARRAKAPHPRPPHGHSSCTRTLPRRTHASPRTHQPPVRRPHTRGFPSSPDVCFFLLTRTYHVCSGVLHMRM
ncbi:hypothetical protein K438DRAFT_1193143 [Mycena galopus ATCC 62051]|nr:hypothetical protein K438DRAFT_483004 [Mycena galopus ATCC 62051]KAF8180976.1 hypothetical protein K438DRAFT_1193143 [Mycena galopus ATCC 62051]